MVSIGHCRGIGISYSCLFSCYIADESAAASDEGTSSSALRSKKLISAERAMVQYFSFLSKQESRSNGTASVRGLERRLSPMLEDARKDVIQKVLSLQQDQRNQCVDSSSSSSSSDKNDSPIALALAASQASLPAKRFARLLGQGDEAIARKQYQQPKAI